MPFVQNTTDLGVTTNSEIKFSTQITSAVSKARQMVAMLNRTVSKMPLEVLLTAYSALWKLGNMSQGDKQSQQEQKKSCPSLIFFSRVNPATTPIVSQWAPTVTIKSRKKGRPLRSPEITFSESMSPQAPQCIRKDPDDMLVRRGVTLVIRELHLSGTHSRRWHTARFNPVISLQTHQGFFLVCVFAFNLWGSFTLKYSFKCSSTLLTHMLRVNFESVSFSITTSSPLWLFKCTQYKQIRLLRHYFNLKCKQFAFSSSLLSHS